MQRQLPRIRPITRSHQDAREGAGRMCESKTRAQIASSVGESIRNGSSVQKVTIRDTIGQVLYYRLMDPSVRC